MCARAINQEAHVDERADHHLASEFWMRGRRRADEDEGGRKSDEFFERGQGEGVRGLRRAENEGIATICRSST